MFIHKMSSKDDYAVGTYSLFRGLLQFFDIHHLSDQLGIRKPWAEGAALDPLFLFKVGLAVGHAPGECHCAPLGHGVARLLNGSQPSQDACQGGYVDDPASVTTLDKNTRISSLLSFRNKKRWLKNGL